MSELKLAYTELFSAIDRAGNRQLELSLVGIQNRLGRFITDQGETLPERPTSTGRSGPDWLGGLPGRPGSPVSSPQAFS